MANPSIDRVSAAYRFKPYFLGGIFAASCATVIGFSQSGLALSNASESCGLVDDQAKPQGHYSRANFTANSAEFTRQNGLFWNSMSKAWLTAEQMNLLQLAYEIGFEDGGHEHAERLQEILMQETIAGKLGRMGHMTAPVGKRSYGVMQVKVTAARDVLAQFAELGQFRADEELIAALLSDDEFNIRVASKFLLLLDGHVRSPEQALVAYNVGLRASRQVKDVQSFKYVVHANAYLEEVVRPFNHRFGDATLRLATANQGASGS